jgi:5-methylcytosine-specific restriction endonuclease McrA
MTGHHGMGQQVLHELYERDAGICQICFRYANILDCNVDHIVPVSKGGTDRIDNLQLSHVWCNSVKSNSMGRVTFNNYWYQKPSPRLLRKLDRERLDKVVSR